MNRVIIDLPQAKLQSLHDAGNISRGDYKAVEVYEEGYREDPEYVKIATQIKEKGREMQELYKKLENYKIDYHAIQGEGD